MNVANVDKFTLVYWRYHSKYSDDFDTIEECVERGDYLEEWGEGSLQEIQKNGVVIWRNTHTSACTILLENWYPKEPVDVAIPPLAIEAPIPAESVSVKQAKRRSPFIVAPVELESRESGRWLEGTR